MGHPNVQFYVRRFDEASWHFLHAHEMYDAEAGRRVATVELAVVHVDTRGRRSCPLPDAAAGRARDPGGA